MVNRASAQAEAYRLPGYMLFEAPVFTSWYASRYIRARIVFGLLSSKANIASRINSQNDLKLLQMWIRFPIHMLCIWYQVHGKSELALPWDTYFGAVSTDLGPVTIPPACVGGGGRGRECEG